ncbi:hypothetical protein QTI17_17220 [Variovorax sp. J31P179]|uniref:hypothetical protein n=1 Tax=Variovorax sp. J31P179 TaxID=3053508 RepID=UPI0025773F95|nr:hypothetical protein [Variovorax sp. J31P179]MDM0082336.1 hypothetical protein [Variovorax sp. J31P179]
MNVIPNTIDCEVISISVGEPSPITGQRVRTETRRVVVGWRVDDGIAAPITLVRLEPDRFHLLRVGKDYISLTGEPYKDYRSALDEVSKLHPDEAPPSRKVKPGFQLGNVPGADPGLIGGGLSGGVDHFGIGQGPASPQPWK